MSVRKIQSVLILLTLLLSVPYAHAERGGDEFSAEPELSFAADRPGFGDATSTLPAMRLALEAGASQSFQEGRLDLELPQLLLRFGLSSWAEIRLQVPSLNLPVDADDVPVGRAGGVGFKMALAPHDLVQLSWVSNFVIPVAELARGESLFGWTSTLNMGAQLTPTFALNATFAGALSYAFDSEDSAFDWELGGALGLSGSFDATTVFAEGIAVGKDRDTMRVALALGLAQMLTPTFQLDFSFEYDLPGYGDATRVGLGVATLF